MDGAGMMEGDNFELPLYVFAQEPMKWTLICRIKTTIFFKSHATVDCPSFKLNHPSTSARLTCSAVGTHP